MGDHCTFPKIKLEFTWGMSKNRSNFDVKNIWVLGGNQSVTGGHFWLPEHHLKQSEGSGFDQQREKTRYVGGVEYEGHHK